MVRVIPGSPSHQSLIQIQTLAEHSLDDCHLPLTMTLLCLFHHSIGLYTVFISLVVVLTPGLAATASSSSESSQSYLNQQALNDILSRAAPIAGKILTWILTSLQNFYDEYNQGIDQGCSNDINTCDWMAKFPDSTKLVHMNLPGTHDASTCWVLEYILPFFSFTNLVVFQGTIQMPPRLLSPVLPASKFYFNSPWTP